MTIHMTMDKTSEHSANTEADMKSAWFWIHSDRDPAMTNGENDAGAFRAFWSGACVGIKGNARNIPRPIG